MEYQPPTSPFGGAPPPSPPQSQAEAAVKWPAIFLIVVCGLGVLYALFSILMAATGAGEQLSVDLLRSAADQMPEGGDELRDIADQMEARVGEGGASGYFFPLLSLIGSALGVYGGIQMLRLKSYGLAMAAAIISIIPCVGPCCCGCAPIGIWALVVLAQPGVKPSFT